MSENHGAMTPTPSAEAQPGSPPPSPTDNGQAVPSVSPPTPAAPTFWQQFKAALHPAVQDKGHKPQGDPFHETLETIVFVVFLVVLLKAFVAEAFVIPTGSMATTLLGYHRDATCDKCGWTFEVNAADETEQGRRLGPITRATCPHCAHEVELRPNGGPGGGDKVLVEKTAFDFRNPHRFDVIVFKFPGDPFTTRPSGPQEEFVAKNYIKRLWGLPGEKLAIWYGDVYLRDGDGENANLSILRTPPGIQLVKRRIVYHNDYQRPDFKDVVPPRWADEGAAGGWAASADGKEFTVTAGDQARWLRYRHYYRTTRGQLFERLQQLKGQPRDGRLAPPPQGQDDLDTVQRDFDAAMKKAPELSLVTDVLGYNTGRIEGFMAGSATGNWVRDLMVEAEVTVEKAQGELTLELVSGVDVHQAVFRLGSGECVLRVLREGQEILSKTTQTGVSKPGKYHLRFGNFDERLTLWINNTRTFGDGVEFPSVPKDKRGPRVQDLRPAGIGVQGGAGVKVAHLQLWRDIYYTRTAGSNGSDFGGGDTSATLTAEEQQQNPDPLAKPAKWNVYYDQERRDYDVKEGEYFALGDNSTCSADSRQWGGVPERLMLGKAVFVYWPLLRFGPIW